MRLKPRAQAMMSEINVIPMADIMLCLLIIFMVVTPMLQPGNVLVNMAQVESPVDMRDADRDDAIVVAITHEGVIYLGANKVSRNEIGRRIADLIASRRERTVFVKSDGRARYGYVVGVVDEIRAAGVEQIGLLTERVREAPATASGKRTGV